VQVTDTWSQYSRQVYELGVPAAALLMSSSNHSRLQLPLPLPPPPQLSWRRHQQQRSEDSGPYAADGRRFAGFRLRNNITAFSTTSASPWQQPAATQGAAAPCGRCCCS